MVNRNTNSRAHGIAKKFVYQGRTIQEVREEATRRSGRFDSPLKSEFDVWVPKQGDNAIRFLPNTWGGNKHFGLLVYVHAYVGVDESTYLCPTKRYDEKEGKLMPSGQPCPMCAAAAAARKAGDEEESKSIGIKERVVYWVLDRDGEPDKPLLWHMSRYFDRDLLNATINDREGSVLQIDNEHQGFDVIVKKTGAKIQTRYQAVIERAPRPISDDPNIQDDVLAYVMEHPLPEVLRYYSYEHLDRVINGTTAPPDTEIEDDLPSWKTKEEPRRSSQPQPPVDDDVDPELEEEGFGEEEVVSAPPPSRPAVKRTRLIQVDDEEPFAEDTRPRPRQTEQPRYPRR